MKRRRGNWIGMKQYKTYKKERYLFFWLSIAAYFLPYIIATACLLPFVKASNGTRVAMGLAVVALNTITFIAGVFKGFRAHFPFVNIPAFAFVALSGFFTLSLFSNYVSTFNVIETAAFVGSLVSCDLWYFHRKYKRKSLTVGDIVKSGFLGTED